jgi:hypothetical protein
MGVFVVDSVVVMNRVPMIDSCRAGAE